MSTQDTTTTTTKPRTILGLMILGPAGAPGARLTSMDDFRTALDLFEARGHRDLDTARAYVGGAQEAFTREAGWKERGLAVATKVYPLRPGAHAATLEWLGGLMVVSGLVGLGFELAQAGG